MDVKFIPVANAQEMQIFVDDRLLCIRPIQRNSDGHEFIYVPNVYRPTGTVVQKYSWKHRIADMVQAIREGLGDCIEVSNLIVRTEHLVRFIDRDYGEPMRQKSISGWEGTEFAWCIYYKNEPLTTDGNIAKVVFSHYDNYPIKFYSSKEEADAALQDLIGDLLTKIKHYYSLKTEDGRAAAYEMITKTCNGNDLLDFVVMHFMHDDENSEPTYIDIDHSPMCVGQIVRGSNIPYNTFHLYGPSIIADGNLFQTRGDAIDNYFVGEDIIEYTLCTHENSIEQIVNRNVYMAGISGFRSTLRTNCYLTIQECFDDENFAEIQRCADYNCLPIFICRAFVEERKLYPIEPSPENPVEEVITYGSKGMLVRANFRPDEVGSYTSRKKIYFPDRSCKDNLCAGRVKITKITDKGSYGFFVGEMVRYESPDEESLAEWLCDNPQYIYHTISFMQNAKYGTFCKLEHSRDTCHNSARPAIYLVAANGEEEKVSISEYLDIYYDHDDDECLESIEGIDFVCSGYTGETFNELLHHYTPFVLNTYGLGDESPKFISKEFDQAIRCKLISIRKYGTIEFCELNSDNILYTAETLQRDLISVITTAGEINIAANEKYASLKRKGKI